MTTTTFSIEIDSALRDGIDQLTPEEHKELLRNVEKVILEHLDYHQRLERLRDAENSMPKRYLSDERRAELLRIGGEDLVFIFESSAADDDDDEEAAWKWLAKAKLAPFVLKRIKRNHGAQFIKDMGFDTTKADAEYGSDWLEDK